MGDNQKPKLIDVAKLAGVSVSTTSVLSRTARDFRKTVREVRAAARNWAIRYACHPESEMTCT